MATFDLIDRPWLPCVTADGTATELGLRQALAGAHNMQELHDPSPLVTIALHRLLLAILHRAYEGPSGMEAWRAIWRDGRFNPERLDAYFDRWRHRFDLFDPERPFFQVPFIADLKDQKKRWSIARLATESSTGSNTTLFDHSVDTAPFPIPFAHAARLLVAAQGFALAGGNSKPFNFSHGAMVSGYSILAAGDTLFETLALNLQPYDKHRPIPWLHEDDPPSWEQERSREPRRGGTPVLGYVDYLTMQGRRIRLIPDVGSDTVTHIQVAQHLTVDESPLDPFKSYRKSKQMGWFEQKFLTERALWRDSTVLFQQFKSAEAGTGGGRPKLMDWLAQIENARRNGLISARRIYRLHAFGLTTAERKAGSVVLWRREELPLPLALLEEPQAVNFLREAIDFAETVNHRLGSSTEQLAKLLLAPLADQDGGRKPDDDSIQRLVDSLGIERRFWPRLAEPFADLLTQLPDDWQTDPENADEIEFGASMRPIWADAVLTAARKAFDEGTAVLDRSGRTLKAVAVAHREFDQRLAKIVAQGKGGLA